MSGTGFPVDGVLYAVAAFSVSIAVGPADLRGSRAFEKIDAARFKLMCVTLGSAAIGCFAQTRELTLLQSAASALIVAALAGAIAAERPALGSLVLYVSAIPLGFVVFSAALDSMWPAILSALLTGAPFLLTAFLIADRGATLLSAAVAALAGASIGVTSAFFVLCAACICALAFAKLRGRSSARPEFAPYIAGFTLFGILLNVSVLP